MATDQRRRPQRLLLGADVKPKWKVGEIPPCKAVRAARVVIRAHRAPTDAGVRERVWGWGRSESEVVWERRRVSEIFPLYTLSVAARTRTTTRRTTPSKAARSHGTPSDGSRGSAPTPAPTRAGGQQRLLIFAPPLRGSDEPVERPNLPLVPNPLVRDRRPPAASVPPRRRFAQRESAKEPFGPLHSPSRPCEPGLTPAHQPRRVRDT
jgi:hypothetical protein